MVDMHYLFHGTPFLVIVELFVDFVTISNEHLRPLMDPHIGALVYLLMLAESKDVDWAIRSQGSGWSASLCGCWCSWMMWWWCCCWSHLPQKGSETHSMSLLIPGPRTSCHLLYQYTLCVGPPVLHVAHQEQ